MTADIPDPGPGSARHVACPVSFLPGPVPDRTVWEGWNRWRLTRRDFVPAPVITAEEHAQMAPRQRRLHDLHRVATHSNLTIQETPMSAWVSRKMRSLIESNAFCRSPDTRPGLMINGGGCQGKTETACEALACFEDEWLVLYAQNPAAVAGTLDLHAPAAYVRTPVKATPISACQRILDFYGEDYKGMRQEDLIRTVKNAVYDHGTKALVIDDVTRLKLHREADQDVLDLIRELMSLPVTLILVGVGIPKSGLLRDGRKDPRTGQWLFPPVKDRGKSRNDDAPGQTDLRFDLVDLDRFTYATPDGIAAWTAHLVGIEQQLRLLHGCDGMLSSGDMPEYLFRRTGGIVGLLRKLIQEGCRHAIETGSEQITAGLLDTLALSPADLPGDLDPGAGEIPDIPARPAPSSRKPRKRRNTVFDDQGTPAAGTAGLPAMPAPRPLSRSMLPIPGESLPGFLLRLSCRLELPPARIARLTGLAPAGHSRASLPVTLLAGIPEPASRTFTFMTRLDDGHVSPLGMSAWQGRYPPLVVVPKDTAPGRRRMNTQVIIAPVTRYCPDCLAGDGSAIQESFGGPWLKAWHLPVIFACPAHQRLLEHLCPECGQPVRGRRPGTQFSLLPSARAAGLHPAQCRTELAPRRGRHTLPDCCGARLDQAANRRPAGPGLIAIQDKILDLLDPGGSVSTISAGQPAQPSGYFADLWTIGLLACSTWPKARHLSPCEESAAAIDEHVASLRRQAEGRQNASSASAARARFDSLPADAAASAGLTHIADRILAGSTDEVREQLRQLLPASTRQARRTVWARRVPRSSAPCSDGLQAASDPLLRRFTKAAGRPQGRRNAVLSPQRWRPENIPAFLPEDWYARHFTPIAGINPLLIRRTAALRLVQMAAGGSLGEAAAFLGIATTRTAWQGRIYSGAGHVHSGARQQPDPLGFETALTALARELDDPATPLVNYKHRRQALENWCIDQNTWASLTARLPPVPGPQRPELGDRKRQIASISVWVQVTSGEHYFAPRPIEAGQLPEIQEEWKERLNTIWHLMHRRRPGPHYASLTTELSIIATSLARTIDKAGSTTQQPMTTSPAQPPHAPGDCRP